MNVSSSCFTSLRWLLLGLLGWASLASAFPPAPTFTVHGIARDQFGWALMLTDEATVVLKQNGVVIAQALVNETIRSGENFRLAVPMDTNPADPYRTGAQTTGTLFAIEVRFPGVTMPVSSLTAEKRTVGQPAENLLIDFTIGVDSDGDGIPDTWEWWQLGEAGIGLGDPRWSLATLGSGDFDGDGTRDYIEYLAGTFAFLNSETLSLKITGWHTDGSAVLSAFLVVDKTYRVEASENLQDWTRVPVRAHSPTAAALTTFTAADTREISLYSAASIGKTDLFYRLVLVR
jgi:hypothetical protein